jgi:hypothetical protein
MEVHKVEAYSSFGAYSMMMMMMMMIIIIIIIGDVRYKLPSPEATARFYSFLLRHTAVYLYSSLHLIT